MNGFPSLNLQKEEQPFNGAHYIPQLQLELDGGVLG
jgi:hypothetical protein